MAETLTYSIAPEILEGRAGAEQFLCAPGREAAVADRAWTRSTTSVVGRVENRETNHHDLKAMYVAARATHPTRLAASGSSRAAGGHPSGGNG
jgi:hypothetical protein